MATFSQDVSGVMLVTIPLSVDLSDISLLNASDGQQIIIEFENQGGFSVASSSIPDLLQPGVGISFQEFVYAAALGQWLAFDIAGVDAVPPAFGSYLLTNSAGTVSAFNLKTGSLTPDFSGTDAALIIREVLAAMPNGGTIFLNNGVYNLNSLVLENTGGFTNHYAIGIPSGGPDLYATFNFIGESFTPAIDEFGGDTVQTGGVVLNLTTTAENSVVANSVIFALWCRPDTVNGVGATLGLKNIDVRIPSNQRGNETAIDCSQGLMADLQYVCTDYDIPWNNIAFPVAGSAGQYGIVSTNSAKEQNQWRNVYAMGSNVGFDIQSEHTILENSYAINCNFAINYGVRGVGVTRGSGWLCCGWGECARGLTLGAQCTAGTLLEISVLDIEDATASIFPAFRPVYHALETNSGNSFGRISYSRGLAGVGNSTLDNLFDGGGGTNFDLVTYP